MLAKDWVPNLTLLADEACLLEDRKLAAYIWCDVFEYCGEAAGPLLDAAMPLLLLGVDSDEPTLRQPSAYGIGVAAAAAPRSLGSSSWVEPTLQRLAAAAAKPGARTGDQESATDNVVSSIGAICVELAAHPAVNHDLDALWSSYLSYLPLRSDIEESSKVTMQLCRLAQAGDAGLLGSQRERLPAVWALLTAAAGATGATAAVHEAISDTIKALEAGLPAKIMAQLWAETPPDVAARARVLVSEA